MTGAIKIETSAKKRRDYLLSLLRVPRTLRTLHAECRAKFPGYPTVGCAVFTSHVLAHAGYDVDFEDGAEELATQLKRRGWTAQQTPQAGDVFVCEDANGNGRSDHIGIVLSVNNLLFSRRDTFTCADNRTAEFGRLYTRNIDEGSFTPVRGFLRYTGGEK